MITQRFDVQPIDGKVDVPVAIRDRKFTRMELVVEMEDVASEPAVPTKSEGWITALCKEIPPFPDDFKPLTRDEIYDGDRASG